MHYPCRRCDLLWWSLVSQVGLAVVLGLFLAKWDRMINVFCPQVCVLSQLWFGEE